MINREYKTVRRKRALRLFTQMAAGFSIFAIVSGIILMSVEASRNFILNSLIEMRGEYVAFDFGADNIPIVNDSGIILGYMPDGFELISNQALEDLITIVFSDDTGGMVIVQRIVNEFLFMGVDEEYTDFSEIQLNMGRAFIFESVDESNYNTVMWEQENDVIVISTSLDSETLIRIAENLSLN
jgi:hypothetical protein